MSYVNVVIDNNTNHTDRLFTYGCKLEDVRPGDRVRVPFGPYNAPRPAYVCNISEVPPEGIKNLKWVKDRDEEIRLGDIAIQMSLWMKRRYFCRYIEAIHCFTPSGSPSKRGKQRRPFAEEPERDGGPKTLTREQALAAERIYPLLDEKKHRVFLVHGVTGSGKTELYLQVIARCLETGRNAIMLVPEIALTPQIVQRFLARFGAESIAVLHSKLSLGERHDEWMRIRRGEVRIVIGARSAIFAPLQDVGIIVLDEEHETTYKSDMTPKYETVEVAEQLGKLHGAVVLLGSATPSVASYRAAEQGRFEKIVLRERYNQTPLPGVEIADMREELHMGNRTIFSNALYEEMRNCLEAGKQIILFLNRRGYSAFLSCRNCGYVMQCPDCGISLTYHKKENEAVCHFCGRRAPVPKICPDCGSRYIKYFGIGTEKVEESVGELFPEASAERLDMDTVKKKGSLNQILNRFAKGKTQILIGTQLVAKGLDFANVGLVGVISADISLNIPDFRSAERTFQLITQAAGRAGRGDEFGKVVVQTYSPEHYAVTCAAAHDYEKFYELENTVRRQIGYPPYSDLICVGLSADTDEEAALAAEKVKGAFLRKAGSEHTARILGPRPSPMPRAGGRYKHQFLIKTPPECLASDSEAIEYIKRKVTAEKEKEWSLSIDVNPYSYL